MAAKEKCANYIKKDIRYRLREGIFIVSFACCLFFVMSLLTYHRTDPSFTHASMHTKVMNAGGLVGAWFADIFLYLFGYMAYFFPLVVFYSGWIYLKNLRLEDTQTERDIKFVLTKLIGFMFIICSGCGLASLHFAGNIHHVPYSAGGILGHGLAYVLVPSLNLLGSTLLFLAMLLTGVTWLTGLSWLQLMDSLGSLALRSFSMLYGLHEKLSRLQMLRREAKEARNKQIQKEKHRLPRKRKLPRLEPDIIENKKPKESSHFDSALSVYDKKNHAHALPALSLLDLPEKHKKKNVSVAILEENSRKVEEKLMDFGVHAQVVSVHPGPVVTRYELQLAPGVKVSKISGLAKDLARSLSVISVRIVEVIQGKSVIGIELPNETREVVRFSEIVSDKIFEEAMSPLTLGLGKDISGQVVLADLRKMPHLLVAGTTGSGKSVGLNAMLLSFLYKATAEQVRLILIDPKMLELSIYDGIPHLLAPVVTDMKEAANALRWCVAEMERRYKVMAALGVRNLDSYNRKVKAAIEKGKPIVDPTQPKEAIDENKTLETLPYIVVVIDEFADMMLVVGKKVEDLIARIAQKARAAGINMILATQRPSVDVITGLIKANVPSRIAFQVSSKIDSRTILDQPGAEQLLGYGDMLYLAPGTGVPTRVHGAFVADHEVHGVVAALKTTEAPVYLADITADRGDDGALALGEEDDAEKDPLYDQAVDFVLQSRRATISSLQRKLRVGYNRAARMIEQMEQAGIVGEMESGGNREILVPEREG